MCIEWCKAQARAHRWQEECLLVEEEMRRFLAYLQWDGGRWERRAAFVSNPANFVAPLRTDFNRLEEVYKQDILNAYTVIEAKVAYARRQAMIRQKIAASILRVWDVSTEEEVRTLKGHTDWVRTVAYLLDGTHIVSGSEDRSVRVWDMSTGEEVRILKGHTDSIDAVAYSPDGTYVVSASRDKSVRVWDVSTGEEKP
ncbi:WD40-repeat-containing domain protein [Coprinopsis sp. MPI-PUGE-AT-0042]|nr:WD40-repeat-containing domain protein [Coprinopsis sp. MPI-PUGE-AT-0042]